MSTITPTLPHPACDELDVRALDAAAALGELGAARRAADLAEADGWRWRCTWSTCSRSRRSRRRRRGSPTSSSSTRTVPCPVAGDGTPEVAERAVVEIGAALGVSYRSALCLVADAVELRSGCRRLWRLVQAGRLQAWKARRVAQATTRLSAEAAGFVDRQAAIAGRRNRLPASLSGLVTRALNLFDPEVAEGLEEAALAHREVVFDYSGTESIGTARPTATLDTLDARDLDAAVSDLAATMGRLGDSSPVGLRRAHALGLLAYSCNGCWTCSAPPPSRPGHRPGVERHPGDPLPPRHQRRPPRRRGGRAEPGRDRGTARRRHPRPVGRLAAPHRPGHHPPCPRPRPGSARSTGTTHPTRCARPSSCATGTASSPAARLDARSCDLDHIDPLRPTRRRRTTRPDQPREPRLPLSTTPPAQDLHRLDLPARTRRQLRLAEPPRHHLHGQPRPGTLNAADPRPPTRPRRRERAVGQEARRSQGPKPASNARASCPTEPRKPLPNWGEPGLSGHAIPEPGTPTRSRADAPTPLRRGRAPPARRGRCRTAPIAPTSPPCSAGSSSPDAEALTAWPPPLDCR